MFQVNIYASDAWPPREPEMSVGWLMDLNWIILCAVAKNKKKVLPTQTGFFVVPLVSGQRGRQHYCSRTRKILGYRPTQSGLDKQKTAEGAVNQLKGHVQKIQLVFVRQRKL
jgi:hypothetical protein